MKRSNFPIQPPTFVGSTWLGPQQLGVTPAPSSGSSLLTAVGRPKCTVFRKTPKPRIRALFVSTKRAGAPEDRNSGGDHSGRGERWESDLLSTLSKFHSRANKQGRDFSTSTDEGIDPRDRPKARGTRGWWLLGRTGCLGAPGDKQVHEASRRRKPAASSCAHSL